MRCRFLFNDDYTGSIGTFLGTAKISRGGTIYLPQTAKNALESHSRKTGNSFYDKDKTICRGEYHSVTLMDTNSFNEYVKKLEDTFDMTTPEGRKIVRYLTSEHIKINTETDKIRLSPSLMNYMGYRFEPQEEKKDILIGYMEEENTNESEKFFLLNPYNLGSGTYLSSLYWHMQNG